MKNWFDSRTRWQKVYLYVISMLLILFFGIGLVPLVILFYLHLGNKRVDFVPHDPRNSWYCSITKGQKVFSYLVSVCLVFFFGVGLVPLAVLFYYEIGVRSHRYSMEEMKVDNTDEVEALLPGVWNFLVNIFCKFSYLLRSVSSVAFKILLFLIPLYLSLRYFAADRNEISFLPDSLEFVFIALFFAFILALRFVCGFSYKKIKGTEIKDGVVINTTVAIVLAFTSLTTFSLFYDNDASAVFGERGASGASEKVKNFCEIDRSIARSIMIARQKGMASGEAISRLEESSGEEVDAITEGIIEGAYGWKITDSNRSRAVKEFSDVIYFGCVSIFSELEKEGKF